MEKGEVCTIRDVAREVIANNEEFDERFLSLISHYDLDCSIRIGGTQRNTILSVLKDEREFCLQDIKTWTMRKHQALLPRFLETGEGLFSWQREQWQKARFLQKLTEVIKEQKPRESKAKELKRGKAPVMFPKGKSRKKPGLF